MLPEASFNADRASAFFDPMAYESDSKLFVMNDNALGFGFECQPLTGADETVDSRINALLNTEWPAYTIVQFSLFTSDNINASMNRYRMMRLNCEDPLMKKMVDNRVDFLNNGTMKSLDSGGQFMVRDFHLVVSVKVPTSGPEPTKHEIEKASDLRIQVDKSLSTVGLFPHVIDDTRYVELMDDLIHKGARASWRDNFKREAESDKPLCEQILDLDKAIVRDKKGIWIGDTRIKTMGVKRFPKVTYPGFPLHYLGDIMTGARGLKSHFMISATMYFPEQQKAKSTMDMKRQFTVSQAVGPLVKFAPIIALKKEGYDVLNEALDDGDKLVRLYFSVSVFGSSHDEAEEASVAARTYLSELGYQIIADNYYCLPLFLNSIPFGGDRKQISNLFRYKTMATRHAATLLPLFGDWKGTGSAVQHMISRNGQIMEVDFFQSTTNYNTVVAASSGAGKSFMIASFINSYLSTGAQAWIIDIGRSYLKLCEMLGGDFIHFGPDSDICLNPFPLIEDYDEESDMLVGLLAAMAAPTQSLTDHQMANLRRIMSELWEEKGKEMSIDLIEQKCLASEDQRVRDIGEQLFSFTSRGEHGKYFNGENNCNFKNPFTVLELDDLQGRTHLQQCVLLQLIYQIQQSMYFGERNRKKLCVIDESWALLTQGDVGKFIEHGFRRFRKYGAGALVISQGVNDFTGSDVGRAIVENSANMLLLRQKGDAVNTLKRNGQLSLSDGAYELLKSVHTSPGNYSEIFFLTEYGQGIGRLVVDPFQQLLFSTKAEDVVAIQKYTEQGIPSEEAIQKVLQDRGLV